MALVTFDNHSHQLTVHSVIIIYGDGASDSVAQRIASDIDSQLYKGRILELLGKREDALTTLAACFRRGATDFQVAPFPDLQALRKDPRYRQLLQSKFVTTDTTKSPGLEGL